MNRVRRRHKNIPVFVPHYGCPNQCSFCNQVKITGVSTDTDAATVEKIVRESLPKLRGADTEIAFFGGSFTAISAEKQEELLAAASKFARGGRISGVRLSTRPDYIDPQTLDRLKKYGVTTIELGVQSMSDHVLSLNRRGHSAQDTRDAVALIREYGFSLGLQIMPGLFGSTREDDMATCGEVIALRPDFVRIYPTVVIAGTMLERLYREGEYEPLPLAEAVTLCKQMLLRFRENQIDVVRLGLMASDAISTEGDVVAGPFHPAFGELVESEIFYDELSRALKTLRGKSAEIFVNPRLMSKAVGNRRSNVKRLGQAFPDKQITFRPDRRVTRYEIKMSARRKTL